MIVDQISYNERLYKLYMKTNQNEKAIEHLEELTRLSSSNSNYYIQILKANGITNIEKEDAKMSEED